MNLPIACSLSEAELHERRKTVLAWVRESMIQAVSTEDGYSYRFQPTAGVLTQLSNLVEMERQCCQFLTFKIVIEPQQPIRLDVGGPPEAKRIIADFFGS